MVSLTHARRRSTRPRAVALVAAVLLLLLAAAAPGSAAPRGGGGNVLPSTAQPHGWSLDRMTDALAPFSTSGNEPQFSPDTPFQVLYVDPATQDFAVVDDTLLATGTNDFQVRPGTMFFVPIWNATDSPPVVGAFPETGPGGAYFFDALQLGARDFTITVDGRTTALGPDDVSSVVTSSQGLEDGSGSRIITVGVFLTPLSPGTHEVTIRAALAGPPVAELLAPLDVFAEDFTYTVTVVPGRGPRD